MKILFNPHTGIGGKNDLHHLLILGYQFYQDCITQLMLPNTEVFARSTKTHLFEIILEAVKTDILAIINQLFHLKCCNYPNTVEYNLPGNVSYSLLTRSNHPIVDQNNLNTKLVFTPQVQTIVKEEKYCIEQSFLSLTGNVRRICIADTRTSKDLSMVIEKLSPTVHLLTKRNLLEFNHLDHLPRNPDIFSNADQPMMIERFLSSIHELSMLSDHLIDNCHKLTEPIVDLLSAEFPFLMIKHLRDKLREIINYRIKHHLLVTHYLDLYFEQTPIDYILSWNTWIGEARIIANLARRHNVQIYGYQHGMFLWEPIYYLAVYDMQFVFSQIERDKLLFFDHNSQKIAIIGFPISDFVLKPRVLHQTNHDLNVLIILQLLDTSPEMITLLHILAIIIPKYPAVQFLIRKHPRDNQAHHPIFTSLLENDNAALDHTKTLAESINRDTVLLGMNSSALLDGLYLGNRIIEWLPRASSVSYVTDYSSDVFICSTEVELDSVLSTLIEENSGGIKNDKLSPISYNDYFNRIFDIIDTLSTP